MKQLKTFLLLSCLVGEVLFVWTVVSNTFGARKCDAWSVACLRTSLVQYFNPRLKPWLIHSFLTRKKLLCTFLKLGRINPKKAE